MRVNRKGYELAFIDFLLGLVAVFTILVIIFLAAVNPPVKTKEVSEGIKPDAQVVVRVEWNKDIDCDVDIYVRDPNNQVVFFKDKDNGIMHIDRDDRGIMHDTIVENLNNEEIISPSNTEYWTLRGKLSGPYLFNVNLFNCIGAIAPIPADSASNIGVNVPELTVKGTLTQINPQFKDIATNTVTLNKVWEEKTLFSFDIAENGSILNIEKDYFEPIVGSAIRGDDIGEDE